MLDNYLNVMIENVSVLLEHDSRLTYSEYRDMTSRTVEIYYSNVISAIKYILLNSSTLTNETIINLNKSLSLSNSVRKKNITSDIYNENYSVADNIVSMIENSIFIDSNITTALTLANILLMRDNKYILNIRYIDVKDLLNAVIDSMKLKEIIDSCIVQL